MAGVPRNQMVVDPIMIAAWDARASFHSHEELDIAEGGVAIDRTIAESWTFRLVSAPDLLLERTLMYNRIVNAPTSFIGHDDLEMDERAQTGLHAPGNLWVNTQRLYDPAEQNTGNRVTNGTTEWQIRNQHRTWVKYMTMSM